MAAADRWWRYCCWSPIDRTPLALLAVSLDPEYGWALPATIWDTYWSAFPMFSWRKDATEATAFLHRVIRVIDETTTIELIVPIQWWRFQDFAFHVVSFGPCLPDDCSNPDFWSIKYP